MWGNTQKVKTAIQEQIMLTFFYNDKLRVVHPYILGIDHQGHTLLQAWQIAGDSQSGSLPGWRYFKVDRLEKLSSLEAFPPMEASLILKEDRFVKIIEEIV